MPSDRSCSTPSMPALPHVIFPNLGNTPWLIQFSSPVIYLSFLTIAQHQWSKLSNVWYSASCLCPTTISFLHHNMASAPATPQKPLCSLSLTASFQTLTVDTSLSFASWTLVNVLMSFLTHCSFPSYSYTASTLAGSPISSVILNLSASPLLPVTEWSTSLCQTPWVSCRDLPLVPCYSRFLSTTPYRTHWTLMRPSAVR